MEYIFISLVYVGYFKLQNYRPFSENVGSVVEWLKHRADDQHGLGSKPTSPFCCVLGKDTLRHFPCLVVLASSSKLQ